MMKSKKATVITAVSGALTAIICAVMNFVTIPHIESVTQGIRCFDMNFAYDYQTAVKLIALLGEEMKAYYLHIQLPLDFVYPVVYTVFFVFVLAKLTGRIMPLCLLPLLLMVADVAENILTIVMLNSAALSERVVSLASAVTSVKTLLMYAVFTVIIICIFYRLIKRKTK